MIYLFISLTIIVIFVLYMVYVAHHDTIDYQTIYDEKLPSAFNNFSILFITDIHRRKINEKTLNKITVNIDIVIIGGDLREKGVPLTRTLNNIGKLKRRNKPVYFIWGNNDYDEFPDKLNDLLVGEGILILANKNHDIFAENGDIISLLGLDCCYNKEARLDLAMQSAKGDYVILVTHSPAAFFELANTEQTKIDTVLAGHTHGGQIRIFGFGLYTRGGYQMYNGTNVFISEGYGYTRLPFRLGTNSECHVINLKKK